MALIEIQSTTTASDSCVIKVNGQAIDNVTRLEIDLRPQELISVRIHRLNDPHIAVIEGQLIVELEAYERELR